MAPLTLAGIGWMLVLLTIPGGVGSLDAGSLAVVADTAGWALVAWGWHRLQRLHIAYGKAWRAAIGTGAVSLGGLLPGPDSVVLVLTIGYAMLPVLTLSLGANALVAAASAGGGSVVAGQASFLRWAGVGVLVAGVLGAVGTVVASSFAGLMLAAAQIGIMLAVWFTVLQLFCSRRPYVRPTRNG